MLKVFGIFLSGEFAPEVVAACSEAEAIARFAIANGSLSKHEVHDADIRELSADEILFWSDRPVNDCDLCVDALKRNHTSEASLMRGYLCDDDGSLPPFKEQSFKSQLGCWQALAFALTGYKPSVQRDRIMKDVDSELGWVQSELRNEFLASMQDEIEEMEEFYNMESPEKIDLQLADRWTAIMPYSEVCMHMRIAGAKMLCEFAGEASNPMIQLYTVDGRVFSSPVTTGEAGVYDSRNSTKGYGFYTYGELINAA